MMLTATKSESSNAYSCHSSSDHVHPERFEGRIYIVPDQPAPDIHGLRSRVIRDAGETRHGYLHACGRREAGVGGVSAAFDLRAKRTRSEPYDQYLKFSLCHDGA